MSERDFKVKKGLVVVEGVTAASLDISGDVDVDGTLEADAMTLNGTAITTTATLSTGISNGNVLAANSNVADNDFLRVDGTSIEGRTATEVRSDLGLATSATTDTTNASNIGSGTLAAARMAAAQTAITSIHATDLIIGEDAQTAIDFGTADEIDFKAANAVQLTLSDGVFRPQTDNDVDLGTSSLKFKNSYFGLVDAENFKVNGGQGSDGQILTSTGSGVAWEDAASGTSFPLEAPDGSAAAPSYTFSSDTNTGIFRENNDNISFSCGGTRKILFTTDGIKMVNGQIQADGSTITSGGGYTFGGDTDTGMEKYFANQLTLRTAGSPRFTIGSSGEIRIGGTTSGNDGDAGTSGQVLTSAGGSSPPTWETPSGGGASVLGDLTDVLMDATNFTDGLLIQPDSDGSAPTTGTLNSAEENIGIGKDVLSALTSADYSTFVGSRAGEAITSGSYNTGFGRMALYQVTTQVNNTAIGYYSGGGIANGGDNTAIGYSVLGANNSASQNTGVGSRALNNTTGSFNTALGYRALYANTSGTRNIAIGVQALDSATTETDNIAIGHEAMYNPNGGDKNVTVGNYSLDAITSGNNNVALGHQAGSAVNSGSNNITIGYQAGDNITSGSNNLVIGSIDTGGATEDGQIRIANGDGSTLWISGDANGIATLKHKTKPVSGGNTTLTANQSGRVVYCTNGTPTLPDDLEIGMNYIIVNDTGGAITPGLGNNTVASGWTANGSLADNAVRHYRCVAAGKVIYTTTTP